MPATVLSDRKIRMPIFRMRMLRKPKRAKKLRMRPKQVAITATRWRLRAKNLKNLVMPAQAGIHNHCLRNMDSCLRRNDEQKDAELPHPAFFCASELVQ